jgi:hypothetical protein
MNNGLAIIPLGYIQEKIGSIKVDITKVYDIFGSKFGHSTLS